jgi:hypothetical protein
VRRGAHHIAQAVGVRGVDAEPAAVRVFGNNEHPIPPLDPARQGRVRRARPRLRPSDPLDAAAYVAGGVGPVQFEAPRFGAHRGGSHRGLEPAVHQSPAVDQPR